LLLFVLFQIGLLGNIQGQALFYLIENRETGDTVRRGTVTDAGLLQNELILAPETIYREWLYDPSTSLIGFEDFETPTAGSRFTIPPIQLRIPLAPDSDNDGLSDDAEYVIGTDPNNPDTSGTGISDGAAIRQGLNPLEGRPVVTGVIASVVTPGIAMDVYAGSGVAVLAAGSAGAIVFSTANSANPIRVAQVDTPGDALRVAGSGNLVVVADGSAGLAVVDVSSPSQARIVRQLSVGAVANAVAVAANIAFVGTSSGQLIAVDMLSGVVLDRLNLGGTPIQDIGVGREVLYVLTDNQLATVTFDPFAMRLLGSISTPVLIANRRLFVGDRYLYAAQPQGVNTFSIADPQHPILVAAAATIQRGWKQLVPTGSRYALAAVSPNLSLDGPHDVSLYDLSDPTNTQAFVTTFPTPGIAFAVSIYNGLAYVADGASGLQVLNYLAFDTGTNPPTISLAASFPLNPAQAEEGKIARVTAQVTDDVQVRNVEFYIDGQLVATDGNFPFEHRFVTPLRAVGRTSFTVQARAFDTGGNATWSQPITVALVPDATPPQVSGTFPADGAIAGSLSQVSATFNEPINPPTLNSNSFLVAAVGPDGLPGTADDVFVAGGVITYNDAVNVATLTFPTNLAPGAYGLRVQSPVADLAGNVIATPFVSRFWITGGVDTDQDGIPDDIEVLLGLNPLNPDTNGNGIWDGDEDADGDGLRNSWEILWGYNPTLADSNSTGTPDGQRDPDADGLANHQEQTVGTNPFQADTDGDGWPDETELTAGSNPIQPASRPKLLFVSQPPLTFKLAQAIEPVGLPANIIVARPPVQLVLPQSVEPVGLFPNVVVARPPVQLKLQQSVEPVGLPANIIVAQPPVQLRLPQSVEPAGLPPNIIVARPPVQLHVPQSVEPAGLPRNTAVANPPVEVKFANP